MNKPSSVSSREVGLHCYHFKGGRMRCVERKKNLRLSISFSSKRGFARCGLKLSIVVENSELRGAKFAVKFLNYYVTKSSSENETRKGEKPTTLTTTPLAMPLDAVEKRNVLASSSVYATTSSIGALVVEHWNKKFSRIFELFGNFVHDDCGTFGIHGCDSAIFLKLSMFP
ncbi:hypothetical protein Tco_0517389 [Tanacetum coccineum]